MAKSKRGDKRSKRIVYVPFATLAVVLVLLIGLQSLHNASSAPSAWTKPVKVSSKDYTPPKEVDVYFISWYGCPFGATESWPLYLALEHFGKVQAEPHYALRTGGLVFGLPLPGLLFQNFTPNSTLHFHFFYMYNQFLNATVNGTPISAGGAVRVGLDEIQASFPSWVYQLVYEYQLHKTYVTGLNGTLVPVIYKGAIPHLVTTLIVTGPKGTWIMLGYPYFFTPDQLFQVSMNSTALFNQIQQGQVPQVLQNASQQILNLIEEAS